VSHFVVAFIRCLTTDHGVSCSSRSMSRDDEILDMRRKIDALRADMNRPKVAK
jgi:hypothetical protein